VSTHVDQMCQKIHKLIDKRDSRIKKLQTDMIKTAEKMSIQQDGHLRWAMENNKQNKKDTFFTIWNLAREGKIRELTVLLTTRKNKGKPQDINEPDLDFGLTAMHYACKKADYPMVLFLLAQGAIVTSKSPDGRTPLHFAAAYSTREIVLELLAVGADYYAADNYGCIPVDMAKQNENKKTLLTLTNWTKLLPESTTDALSAASMAIPATAAAIAARTANHAPTPTPTSATAPSSSSVPAGALDLSHPTPQSYVPASATTASSLTSTPPDVPAAVIGLVNPPLFNTNTYTGGAHEVSHVYDGVRDSDANTFSTNDGGKVGDGNGIDNPEKHDAIPKEFRPPDGAVYDRMSRTLQILSFRLEKHNRFLKKLRESSSAFDVHRVQSRRKRSLRNEDGVLINNKEESTSEGRFESEETVQLEDLNDLLD
jgi:hypothetical protein